MNNQKRRQLTLFVDNKFSQGIESVRSRFNPEQYKLIDSHVTLCREDEMENMHAISGNLKQLSSPKIMINFGSVTRFEDGLGVWLPALGDHDEFHMLRLKILSSPFGMIRKPKPHITLMHPRNSKCTDEIFSAIKKVDFPTSIIFDNISLIEQVNGGRWHSLETYQLTGN